MDFSQLTEENYDIKLSKVFAELDKMIYLKELKKCEARKKVFDYTIV
jgi:hypothetical protein